MIPDSIHQSFSSCFPAGITTIDSHTAGEYTRLILNGTGPIPGETLARKREFFMTSRDSIRRLLTREPRGNRDVVAAAVTEPVSPEADFGLIYMDAQRYPYLCGHATIGAVTTLVQLGMIDKKPDPQGMLSIVVDTPSGPMPVQARVHGSTVREVAFLSVPCFVQDLDVPLEIPDVGVIKLDLVCAGGFFAMVDMDQPVLQGRLKTFQDIIDLGMEITAQACRKLKVHHPERPEVRSIDVTEFYRQSSSSEGKGYVVYGQNHLDRSPCGTGTAAKLALLRHRGLFPEGAEYTNKGPLDTEFQALIAAKCSVGNCPAIQVKICGSAHITGLHCFVRDEHDPFPQCFLL
ncbi:MAG: proline racemase family protein [Desulfonatronovibrionaceae bacterium]